MNTTLPVTVGEYLFEFASHTQWVHKAVSWYANCGKMQNRVISIDAAGRICRNGCDFNRADREGTFPVRVFTIDLEYSPPIPCPCCHKAVPLDIRHFQQTMIMVHPDREGIPCRGSGHAIDPSTGQMLPVGRVLVEMVSQF